jgi:hypothetical protein
MTGMSLLIIDKEPYVFGLIVTLSVIVYARDDNKIKDHIFRPGHFLDRLSGNTRTITEKVIDGVLRTDKKGLVPPSGPFRVSMNIDGYPVEFGGTVINGELKVGTFFIPEDHIKFLEKIK